jgi:hypothetical protein
MVKNQEWSSQEKVQKKVQKNDNLLKYSQNILHNEGLYVRWKVLYHLKETHLTGSSVGNTCE